MILSKGEDKGILAQSIENAVKYFKLNGLRGCALVVAYWTVIICFSWLGYETFSLMDWRLGLCILASMVVYDLVIAPALPNVLLYLNSWCANIFSIGLMVFAGLATTVGFIASKEDPTLAIINQKLEVQEKDKHIAKKIVDANTDFSSSVGFGINSDKKMIKDQAEKNSKSIDYLQSQTGTTMALLDEKLAHIESQGGKYTDPSIKVYHTIHQLLYKDKPNAPSVDQISFWVMVIVCWAILSIQTHLAAHLCREEDIYRPTVLQFIVGFIKSFTTLKKEYIKGVAEIRHIRKEYKDETNSEPDKKDTEKKSLLSRLKIVK